MRFFTLRRLLRRHQERHATRHAFLVLLGAFLLLTTGAATAIRVIEGIPYGDAFWQVWQTVTTVGYGDGPSRTRIGRTLTVVYGTLGIVAKRS